MPLRIIFFIFTFFLSFSSDFFSKKYIRENFDFENQIEISKINSFLNFHISCNKGISFSFFKNFNVNYLNIVIGFLLLILLIYIIKLLSQYFQSYKKKSNNDFLFLIGFILIFGGALGNFIDRIQNQCVLDFLDFHIKNQHFFIFNIADFFISFGFFLIILIEIRKKYYKII